MRSQIISLSIKPSKIPIAGLAVLFVTCKLIVLFMAYSKIIIFAIFMSSSLLWLLCYLRFTPLTLEINTLNRSIKVVIQHNIHDVFLYKVYNPSWWLSIMPIKLDGKIKIIFIFADSVPLTCYRLFKIFTIWT